MKNATLPSGHPRDTRSEPAVVAAELSGRNLDNIVRHYRQPEAMRHAEQYQARKMGLAA